MIFAQIIQVKIYKSIDAFKAIDNAVVTIGTFDGVHVGHQKLIQRLDEIALQSHGEVVLLTFFPHPRMVLHPENHGLQLLNTMDEKMKLLEHSGIGHLIIHPFSKEFSRLTSVEFVRDILVNKIGMKKLVIGYDHHFGRNREGSIEALNELSPVYDFDVNQIPEQEINDIAVSSTKIRNALIQGEISTANSFLGYKYELTGMVVKGHQVGRSLGYPTANISVDEDYKLIPGEGIYAVTVFLIENNQPKKFKGALSIGTRPTFNDTKTSIEVYIIDFDKNIYDQKITLQFEARIRGQKKFDNTESLIAQINSDVEIAKNLITINN